MTVNEDLADLIIGHRLNLLRYEAGTAQALLKAYDAAFADIKAQMEALAVRAKAATTDKQAASIGLQLRLLSNKATDLNRAIREVEPMVVGTIDSRLAEIARVEALFMDTRIAKTVGLSWSAVPEASVVAALATPIAEGVARAALRTDLLLAAEGVQAAVARAMASGASMPRTAGYLRAGTDLVETYRGRFVTIARTEVQRVANAVALESYRANADVLDGVEWLATLDSRTCLICAPLHGTEYKLVGGEPVGMPPIPAHPRCRCMAAPVVKSYADLGLTVDRAAKDYDGRPSKGPTFPQWLRRQPAETADDILGPTRAALWRSGTPLAAFSDGRRVLNLGELEASL